ncbi:Transcription initiation factor TFIID subunit 8 [[Candida] zeylanoides]
MDREGLSKDPKDTGEEKRGSAGESTSVTSTAVPAVLAAAPAAPAVPAAAPAAPKDDAHGAAASTSQSSPRGAAASSAATAATAQSPSRRTRSAAAALANMAAAEAKAESAETKTQSPAASDSTSGDSRSGGSRSPQPPREEYIPPLRRRLSPETQRLLAKPTASIDTATAEDLLLLKIIALMLQSTQIAVSEEALWRIADLTALYLHDLVETLHKYTELQRKSRPSKSDVVLLLQAKHIEPGHLHREFERAGAFSGTAQHAVAQRLEAVARAGPHEEVLGNEHYEIADLVPRSAAKPAYVPSFLPDLPPDYTYQATPQYMKRSTDMRAMRVKLVEESRLTERSLYSLADDDEDKWRQSLEREMEHGDTGDSDEDSLMDRAEPPTDVESVDGEVAAKPGVAGSKRFDIVRYAHHRLKIRAAREARVAAQRQARAANVFVAAEEHFSPYATKEVTPEIERHYESLLQNAFKEVIVSVRHAEQHKKRKLAQVAEERAHRERERAAAREEVEFGFAFNGKDASSDDDSDVPMEEFPEFDFPVAEGAAAEDAAGGAAEGAEGGPEAVTPAAPAAPVVQDAAPPPRHVSPSGEPAEVAAAAEAAAAVALPTARSDPPATRSPGTSSGSDEDDFENI